MQIIFLKIKIQELILVLFSLIVISFWTTFKSAGTNRFTQAIFRKMFAAMIPPGLLRCSSFYGYRWAHLS